ncbi:hypothetical protein [Gordonia sp. ABSL49_1]|uniref:hypothetical protein n=1 Tax=Gordonia sp. ABSL49_1 TaxID=2920941 RepID=UPI001F0F25D7|nr:hypothetical protein [Gordonia sp. ABSL49_1]MCH5645128.1 hypothetical protein [Gordonia sp. ABSL49_1]
MSTEGFDITQTIEADSTQVNADELTETPRVVTITGVGKGTADQPVNIELAEFPGKAYRPCKSMRRVLVNAWGADASAYVGRRMAIFNDRSVRWGGQAVGGVRIKALSHIDQPITLALTVTRGKRAPYRVEPLPDEPAVSKIPASFDAKIAASSAEQCVQAREYLAKFESSEPERVAELLKLVAEREAVLSGGETA